MMKQLTEMTNEELWRLFPIQLAAYDPAWPQCYARESAALRALLQGDLHRIRHIGSTAVPGLLSKPTIDILVEVHTGTDIQKLISHMEDAGYIHSPQPANPPPHCMFLKGYTPGGFVGQAYHTHIRYPGDWDEILFRDHLRTHPESAAAYARLKQRLAREYQHDRDAYTQAKGDFIGETVAQARQAAARGAKGELI